MPGIPRCTVPGAACVNRLITAPAVPFPVRIFRTGTCMLSCVRTPALENDFTVQRHQAEHECELNFVLQHISFQSLHTYRLKYSHLLQAAILALFVSTASVCSAPTAICVVGDLCISCKWTHNYFHGACPVHTSCSLWGGVLYLTWPQHAPTDHPVCKLLRFIFKVQSSKVQKFKSSTTTKMSKSM